MGGYERGAKGAEGRESGWVGWATEPSPPGGWLRHVSVHPNRRPGWKQKSKGFGRFFWWGLGWLVLGGWVDPPGGGGIVCRLVFEESGWVGFGSGKVPEALSGGH